MTMVCKNVDALSPEINISKYKRLLSHIYKPRVIDMNNISSFKYLAVVRVNKILYFKNSYHDDDFKFMFVHKFDKDVSKYKSMNNKLNGFMNEFKFGDILVVTDDLHIRSLKDNFLENISIQTLPLKNLNFSLSNIVLMSKANTISSRIRYTLDFTQSKIFDSNHQRSLIYSTSEELKNLIEKFENSIDITESALLLHKIIKKRKSLSKAFKKTNLHQKRVEIVKEEKCILNIFKYYGFTS